MLPGVKETRANLYYLSRFQSLADISRSTAEEIIQKMVETIKKYNLDYSVALPKEVKTHIAVSKIHSLYRI